MVWLRARTAAVAFEIRHRQGRLDVPASRKDIEKLNNMNSLRGYLVNVSDISGKAFFIQVQTSLDRGPVAVRTKAYTVESVRAKYPQAYAKWDPKEDETLTKEFRENLDIESIAKHHGRQAGAPDPSRHRLPDSAIGHAGFARAFGGRLDPRRWRRDVAQHP